VHHHHIAMWAKALTTEDAEIGSKLQAGAAKLTGMVPVDWNPAYEMDSSTVQPVDYTTRPESPLPQPGDVKDANDVHRLVDPLPPGRHPGVKTLPNTAAIEALYRQLTQESVPGPPSTYPGEWRVLEDGTKIGLRTTSKFGGPTVEIWYPDGAKADIHLAEPPAEPRPAPQPAPVPIPAPDSTPSTVSYVPPISGGPLPVPTPEEGGILGAIGAFGIGIVAGAVELGKAALSP
jgi:hypothetical protein